MAKTDRDVVNRALRLLNVVASDQTPDSNDYADARAEYVGCHQTIMRRLQNTWSGRGSWALDNVPDEAFPFVARILADQLVAGNIFRVDDHVPGGEEAFADLALIYSRRKKQNERYPNMPTSRAWPGQFSGGRGR